jgi:hypothetical protein
MAAKKMTVRDAYAKAKKSEGAKGGTLYKGSKGIQRARAESKSQNPSARNKVGAKPKDKKGPWDNIGRGLKTGAKVGLAIGKEALDTARNPVGAAVKEVKGIRKDVKEGNLRGIAIQALGAVPMGRGAKAVGKALKTVDKAADAAKKVSPAVEAATKELSAIRQAKAAFKGQKVSGGKASAGWAELGRKERRAQEKLNNVLRSEQKVGKSAENMKKIGKTEPKRVDLSEGQTITKNKGIQAPEKPRAYSKVGRTPRDRSGNAPLEKNQRYTYEADEMRRIEGKERFERREQRRFEKSTKNKERQAKADERAKINRNQEKYDRIKKQAETGGPKAKQRLKRYEDWAKEAGVWGSLKK